MIGRVDEIKMLNKMLQSSECEFVALFGRRRVGKTYLISEIYKDYMKFEMTGIQNGKLSVQLQNFRIQFKKYFPEKKITKPKNWLEAFTHLTEALDEDTKTNESKQVIFIDELPWVATKRSNFLSALTSFWNNWASKKNVVVVICGSAASWMIKNIIHNKGGLYNRVTARIHLQPFTLGETEQYLQSRNVLLNRDQIIKLYMVMGGIPHYLKAVEPGLSAMQNIQKICFTTTGLLYEEYSRLYEALFENAHLHKLIVHALFEKNKGLTRQEILLETKLKDNGEFSKILEELESSGFILKSTSFDKVKRKSLYRLIDEYSLFYNSFIKEANHQTDDHWMKIAQSQTYKIWCGYAFENICFRHLSKIKQALGIAGVYTNFGSFYHKDTGYGDGAQIDIIIDRADDCLNIIDCKYYSDPFYISSSQADNLRKKRAIFNHVTKNKKQVFFTIVSPLGFLPNRESVGLIDSEVRGEALF